MSIGAINAAIITGNPPNAWVDRLREFWTQVRMDLGPAQALDALNARITKAVGGAAKLRLWQRRSRPSPRCDAMIRSRAVPAAEPGCGDFRLPHADVCAIASENARVTSEAFVAWSSCRRIV